MHRRNQQKGFTLIEVVVVLGITALMLAAYLQGQGDRRDATRFAADIDGIKAVLDDQQNQAQRSVVQPTRAGNYGKATTSIFGKVVEFSTGSPTTYAVATLLINDNEQGGLVKCDTETHNLPSGIRYSGSDPGGLGVGGGPASQAIIFTKIPAQAYITSTAYTATAIIPPPPSVAASCTASPYVNPLVPTAVTPSVYPLSNNILNPSNYNPGNPSFLNPGNLLFQQSPPAVKKALIQIIPSSNTIGRKVLE